MKPQSPIQYEDIAPQYIEFLAKRGIEGKEAVLSHLYPRLADLPSPEGMAGLTEAVEHVLNALKNSRNIVIWGDYDVDGTTGTSLLITFFQKIGKEVYWHIPDRQNEGYGLNLEYLRKIAEKIGDSGYLLLTVDCGIANFAEITEIQKWGCDVIVTDHHQIQGNKIPPCIVVNPQQSTCSFAQSHLAGVGVAFYLAAGIRAALSAQGFFNNRDIPNLKSLLAYVALGSVADMVPLQQINRILVRAGLESLENSDHHGLSSLLKNSGIHGRIYAEDIGYALGPKINAAGRMGKADLAIQLLISSDLESAEKTAQQLTLLNNKRKQRSTKDLESALYIVDRIDIAKNKCCVILGDFFQGTLGITASKMVEKLKVPVVICTFSDHSNNSVANQIIKGSGRSIEGINLFEAISFCGSYLEAYGGHSMAAGISLYQDNFSYFINKLTEHIKYQQSERKIPVKQPYDIHLPIHLAMQPGNLELFSLLDPFGQGNEKPILYDDKALVIETRYLGSAKEHIQLSFRGNGINFRGIGFNLAEKTAGNKLRGECEILYTLSCNRFKEKAEWQIQIIDIW